MSECLCGPNGVLTSWTKSKDNIGQEGRKVVVWPVRKEKQRRKGQREEEDIQEITNPRRLSSALCLSRLPLSPSEHEVERWQSRGNRSRRVFLILILVCCVVWAVLSLSALSLLSVVLCPQSAIHSRGKKRREREEGNNWVYTQDQASPPGHAIVYLHV